MSEIGDKLREIIGQETEPPLWIYVTKDQVPVLERAAAELEANERRLRIAFARGIAAAIKSLSGEHAAFRALAARYY